MRVRRFHFEFREGADPHEMAFVNCKNGTEIQISESPTGRSIQVYVGSKKVYPQQPTTEGSNT